MKHDLESIGAAIGRIPSGCFILTVADAGRATGVLVSWVQQASFTPPMVTVCMKRGRSASELVDRSGHFLLNAIGDNPTVLFRHFGKGFALEEDAFAGLTVEATEFGPLILMGMAHLGCRVLQKVPLGDHDLYAAEVIAARGESANKPYVHLRKSGLSY